MKVERDAAFEVEDDWGLLPWLCDSASKVMDVLFRPGVSARTLMEIACGEQQSSKEEIGERLPARGRARYSIRESVIDLLCERPLP